MIGDVAEVLHWTNRPIWPQGEIKRQNLPVPATLDYDLWLGVAPKKSFDDKIVPFAWRGWKDYGCGAVGDMACHIMDSSFSGLDLGIPLEVEAEASGSHKDTFPMASTINFTFADRKGKKAPRLLCGGRRFQRKETPKKFKRNLHHWYKRNDLDGYL